jgi:hypothetical protein
MERAGRLTDQALDNVLNDRMDADDHMVRVATVHIRQDVAGTISVLMDTHSQLVTISRGVWVIVALAAVALIRLFL